MARLCLTLLGGFQARIDSGAPLALPTRKAQLLLAYLVLPLGRQHPRDTLAALLWGGIREESARASLRQALFAIRRALGAAKDVVHQDGDALALDPTAVEADVAAFEDAVARGTPEALEHAADLYRGDLLSGFAVDEPPFEEWLLGERERLRELALEALARLLAHQRNMGATEEAIQTALRLLTLEPVQEPVHRALMRLYAKAGRRGAALRQYQQCVSALGRELGVEPEPETKALYQELLQQKPTRAPIVNALTVEPADASSRAPVAEAAMIGRASELARLREALDHARAGHGLVAAVMGEGGIGKTRLLSELIATAEAQGVRVVVGRSYESEQILPFGPWVDAFRTARATDELQAMAPAQRAELAHLLPDVAGADVTVSTGAPDFLKVFESVSLAVAVLATPRPLLLAVEDVHWADEMSQRLLAFVGRRLAALPVLIVATARDEELADAPLLRRILDELGREQRLISLTLSGLSRNDTLALVYTLARAGTDAATLAHLGEVAWEASAGNPFVVVETVRSQTQGVGRSNAVRQLVTTRLERLSERARLLTTVAAVIGREFEFALLQRAADVDEPEAADAMEELVRRRVLQGVGERFDFTHDRLRDVVAADVLAPRRRVLHRRVAEAIIALYADDLERQALALGRHYEAAEMWPEALEYLRRAAARAFAQSAYRESASCFEAALRCAARLPPAKPTLDLMLDMQLQLRSALWPLADFERIAAVLGEAERLATALDDRQRLGRTIATRSVLHWISGDSQAAHRFAEKARDMATSTKDEPLRLMSNYYLGLARYLLADYRGAEAAYLENVQVPESSDANRLGASSTLLLSRAWLVLPLAERGDFAAALDHGRTALDQADAVRDLYGAVSAGYSLAYVHVLKGEPTAAIPLLERSLASCREREFGVWMPQILGCLGHAHALNGRVEEGLALLTEAIAAYDATHAWPFRALFTAYRAAACLRAGRRSDALALGREALALAREHHERGHEAWALRVLGEVVAESDATLAERHYRDALTIASELGMRPLAAHCHLGLGKLGVRDHLTMAAAIYAELGMDMWLARVEGAPA